MNVVAKKSLGQNFLIDEKVLNLIVDLGKINSKDIVLEVGPGTGNLTENILLKNPVKLLAIEKDKSLTKNLHQKFQDKNPFFSRIKFRVKKVFFPKTFLLRF